MSASSATFFHLTRRPRWRARPQRIRRYAGWRGLASNPNPVLAGKGRSPVLKFPLEAIATEPERNLAAEIPAPRLLVSFHLANALADLVALGLGEGGGEPSKSRGRYLTNYYALNPRRSAKTITKASS